MARFADMLALHGAKEGARTALVTGDGRITYAQLADTAQHTAAFLWHECGVRPGGRVAWLGANDPAQIVLLFALARIGAILLPLNFRLAPPEWSAQFAQCKPMLLVHDAAFAIAARELAVREGVACIAGDDLARGHDEPPPHHARDDAPVLLVFTSGTTGSPKAAVHTQANLLANMRIASAAQSMTPADKVLTVLPLFHVGGLCIQTLPALFSGAQVVLHARFAPDATFDAIERERPTLTLQVPATMRALIEHPRWPHGDLSSLRAVWAGSSIIPAPLVEAFHARGVPVCNVYGSTETGPFSIALPPHRAMEKLGSCGWPAPGVEARLVNGEVQVRGPNVVSRYWPNEAACDSEGWFHTGDMARQDDDGSFTIVGRAKELVISGGENIHPAEIEAALATHDAVLECAAFGVPDAQWGEVVAVAVALRPGSQVREDELRAYLEGRIARFKIPRRWMFVDALPKTALGKVQRGVLARLAMRLAG